MFSDTRACTHPLSSYLRAPGASQGIGASALEHTNIAAVLKSMYSPRYCRYSGWESKPRAVNAPLSRVQGFAWIPLGSLRASQHMLSIPEGRKNRLDLQQGRRAPAQWPSSGRRQQPCAIATAGCGRGHLVHKPFLVSCQQVQDDSSRLGVTQARPQCLQLLGLPQSFPTAVSEARRYLTRRI